MKRTIPLILLCVFFLGMAGHYGMELYGQWREYRTGEAAYEELTQYIQPETAPVSREPVSVQPLSDGPESTEDTDNILWPRVDFEALAGINPDIVAWICIEGTNISYPVVRGSDNSRYLNLLFDGTPNGAGSIFMDYRNHSSLSDRNTILYGHNMQNGTMFHQILGYKEQEFYDAHPYALLITPEGNYRIEFIAGYVTDLNSDAWKLQFASDEEFSRWLQNAVDRSTFTATPETVSRDRVVTLSTCTYEYSDARFVLVGILTQK